MKPARMLSLLFALLLMPAAIFGQDQPSARKRAGSSRATQTAATTAPAQLTVNDVIKMAQAKLSETIIAAKIKKNGTAFDLSADQLVALKGASASDELIQLMMDPSRTYEAPKPPAPLQAVAVAPPLVESRPAAAPVAPEQAGRDVGVYAKKGGEWIDVLPEVVNFKTGGVLKNIASAGVVKGDVNGNIAGPNSRTSLKSPMEFLIVAPEGVAITEYQLLRLRPNKDYREFRSVTGGVMHVSGGAMRDLIPFEGKKVGSRNYSVVLQANMGAGEYGFLPPGAMASSNSASMGKMFTFHLIE